MRLQLCDGLHAARLTDSSSSPLVGKQPRRSWPAAAAACAMTKLAILQWWVLFNCSSTLHPTCIVMFVCCQFAHDVPLTDGQPAPPAPRRRSCVSRLCASSPNRCHALPPKHSSRRRPSVLGTH
ncbi:hypothetical protein BU25DRAFT_170396 [Macroventuria anomochaeta]|uniref:Uncharacterized protein n=1 Tax=Macroventuria anomochaeta TaxID=301207 RepID=A0ACB6RRL1_9PLEO|nr:uncharacterized protein BU25DRAFT_170396 [Macroventuria anomochaeta]KAF2623907.1 hypothetical protein BU25DRAFT_170396 [Macroventuria anomochaeta]